MIYKGCNCLIEYAAVNVLTKIPPPALIRNSNSVKLIGEYTTHRGGGVFEPRLYGTFSNVLLTGNKYCIGS